MFIFNSQVMNYHRLDKIMKEDGLISAHSQSSSKKVKADKAVGSPSSSKHTASGTDSSNSAFNPLGEDTPDNTAELYTFAPCCHKDGICNDTCLCVVGSKFCETPCGCLKSCKGGHSLSK